ncbi:hypothetical protein TNCV_4872081 [Trichonephila clavipes]|nr:hypothetical protein TNCV_4872081 [Trichonephila clavipes]
MRTLIYAIFKSHRLLLFLVLLEKTENQAKSVPELDEICSVVEEVVDLALELNTDDVQELLDSRIQELTLDKLIEMHVHFYECIEELENL